MGLSSDLISQFVKITNDEKKEQSGVTVYGTIVYDGKPYVKLDGSELLTPVSTTTDVADGERVTVMIKDHTATVTGNISSPAARTDDVKEIGAQITEFEIIIADKVSVEQLEAEVARIDSLVAENVTIKGSLEAVQADIGELEADNVTINEKLTAAEAEIKKVDAEKVSAEFVDANYATIVDLDATNASVHNLEATYGEINTLIFGSASGGSIQTSFANAVIAQLGNAQIKSAMIESIAAEKISAGNIITNDIHVMSEDGNLLISDETIQISDNTRVRVQIGKDAEGDYSINIWDADGNLMFSEGGITDKAIKGAIIRNDMVSENANISASKLDINSLFKVINEDGSHSLKASKIYFDDEKQTLDVAFTEMASQVDDIDNTVSTQGTQISVIQGQISNKIWKQDIDDATGELETQYSALNQEIDSISATIVNHETLIDKKADSATVTEVSDKVAEMELNLDGFRTTVSSTYATKTEVKDELNEAVADIEIGAKNLIRNSTNLIFDNYYFSGEFVVTHDGNGNVTVVCGATATYDEYGNTFMRTSANVSDDGNGNVRFN